MRRRLVGLRRVVTPQRDLAGQIAGGVVELPGLDDEAERYFRDVYDHLIRVSDMIDSYRDLVTGAMDVYLSTVSNRLNLDRSKRLTVISTIVLPLIVLTGFFGQNFAWMVRHVGVCGRSSSSAFGLPVVAVVLLVLLLRRQRLIKLAELRIVPLTGIPEVLAGDDLGALLADAVERAGGLRRVTSSWSPRRWSPKAEGRVEKTDDVVEVVLREAARCGAEVATSSSPRPSTASSARARGVDRSNARRGVGGAPPA